LRLLAPLCLSALLHTQELGETPLGEARWQVESHPAFSARTSALSLAQDDVFLPNQLVDVYVRLRNERTHVAPNVRLLLYVSAEARLESVEGATRDRSTLLFGAVAPAQSIEARLGVRLLRSLAKAHPVTIEAVVRADELLPLQLDPLTIVTSAEPNFAIGVLSSEPADAADPMVAGSLIDTYRPGVLVLNAGATPLPRPIQHNTWESFSRNWEVDVAHVFHWTREALLAPLETGTSTLAVRRTDTQEHLGYVTLAGITREITKAGRSGERACGSS